MLLFWDAGATRETSLHLHLLLFELFVGSFFYGMRHSRKGIRKIVCGVGSIYLNVFLE